MKYPTLVEHIYSCMDKADKSFAEIEALLAISSMAGFEVPLQASLAFRASRGFLKIARTKKFNFIDAVVDGIALAVPSAKLSGYNKYPAINRGAKMTQLAMKKILKGESVHPVDALAVYSSVVPSLTSKKIGASTASLIARQYGAISALIPKTENKSKKSKKEIILKIQNNL